MILDSIKAIIDLLKIKKDSKKVDLEIAKLKREENKDNSLIQIASFEDVQKFDYKTKRIMQIAKARQQLQQLQQRSKGAGYTVGMHRKSDSSGCFPALLSIIIVLTIIFVFIFGTFSFFLKIILLFVAILFIGLIYLFF